jgi:hypothetical protein
MPEQFATDGDLEGCGWKILRDEVEGLERRHRHFWRLVGPPDGAAKVYIHANTRENMRRAAAMRVFTRKNRIDLKVGAANAQRYIKPWLELARQAKRRLRPHRWSEEEVLAALPPAKRPRYAKAHVVTRRRGLRRRDFYNQGMVKHDKAQRVKGKPDRPRAIQFMGPRGGLALARHVKPFEHWFIGTKGPKRAGLGRTRLMAKGLTQRGQAELLYAKMRQFCRPRVYSMDASSFDCHCRRFVLRCVHLMYKAFLGPDAEVAWISKQTLTNVVFGTGGFTYKVDGRRMSGHMDTGVGNAVIALMLTTGIMADLGVAKFDVLNNGDDQLLIVEEGTLDVAAFNTAFRAVGFEMKAELCATVHEAEFCRAKVVECFDGPRFVRLPMRALATMFTSHEHYGGRDALAYVKATALCSAYVHRGEPMMGPLASKVLDLVKGYPLPGDWARHDGVAYKLAGVDPSPALQQLCKPVQPSGITRMQFHLAFGITPGEQAAYERAVQSLTLADIDPARCRNVGHPVRNVGPHDLDWGDDAGHRRSLPTGSGHIANPPWAAATRLDVKAMGARTARSW